MTTLILLFSLPWLFLSTNVGAQKKSEMTSTFKIVNIKEDFPIGEIDHQFWQKAKEVTIDKYWSGKKAPTGRQFKAKLLWSETALYVRFEANQAEPLVISDAPDLSSKTIGLWDRDVCEIFLAPNAKEFRKYFEFEVAPTGEWIDLAVYQMRNKRITDREYSSGMKTSALIEKDKIWIALKIEWKAFGKTPKAGEIWKGNLFRCLGEGETRGYLAWQATKTDQPNFHVPAAFGNFEFE